MAYSRFATKWPGGGESWYVYHDVNGLLCVMAPNGTRFLNERDTHHLRDVLNQALRNWHDDRNPAEATEATEEEAPTAAEFYEELQEFDDRQVKKLEEAVREAFDKRRELAPTEHVKQELHREEMLLIWPLHGLASLARRYREARQSSSPSVAP